MNSVVMNYVTLEDGCQVQGSVICSNAHLQERVNLKDCQVKMRYDDFAILLFECIFINVISVYGCAHCGLLICRLVRDTLLQQVNIKLRHFLKNKGKTMEEVW